MGCLRDKSDLKSHISVLRKAYSWNFFSTIKDDFVVKKLPLPCRTDLFLGEYFQDLKTYVFRYCCGTGSLNESFGKTKPPPWVTSTKEALGLCVMTRGDDSPEEKMESVLTAQHMLDT